MASLGNVKVKTLRDIAYESINEAIMRHELMPGETLTITSLAEKLGISATPVREAVVRLSNEGILDYEANKRVKVSRIERQDVGEVYEARRLLEIYISRKLVPVVKKNKKLRKRLEALRWETSALTQSTKAVDRYTAVDLKLHEIFLDMASNHIIKDLLYHVGNKSLRIRTFAEASKKSAASGASLVKGACEHLEIVEALLDCDEKRVVRAMETHLNNSEQRTLKSLDDYFN